MREVIITILRGFDQKNHFFEWCSWFKFNNLELALGMALKFDTSVARGLKLKVRKFWGLIPTFVEVIGEKKAYCLPPPSIGLIDIKVHFTYMVSTYMLHVWLHMIRNKQNGDTEQNSRPKPNSCQTFPICHWSLKNISAHSFIKYLLTAYIAVHKFDVLNLLEIYPSASI